MKKSRIFITVFFVVIATVILTLTINALLQRQNIPVTNELPENYKIEMPPVPKSLEFCDEKVPLNDIEVRERIEREFIVNTYWHSSTIQILKKSTRWFPLIEEVLKKNSVPDDFKYLCVAESNLSNVASFAGAEGFWQFIEKTAKYYGLEVTKEVDERYNVEKSTQAACAYLNEAYQKYGSWTMAAASFNTGFDNLDTQIARQKSDYYYNLVLNDETSRYIFRVLAIKEILLNPEDYGFYLRPEDYYQPIPTEEIRVTSSINHLADFAARHKINYKYLKYFNPWLRDNYLPVKRGKIYFIKIPKPGSVTIIPDRNE